jgi:hexokinase
MKSWEPDAAVGELTQKQAHLVAETDLSDAKQTGQMVDQIFRDHAVSAALSVCHIAMHSGNDRMRFTAAQYVIERGTAVDSGTGDALHDLVGELTEILRANPAGS